MLKKILPLLFILLFITPSVSAKTEGKEGEYRGAKTASHPTWFKDSFLDLDEDVADATDAGKRLVLYFWQPGCPYCSQLWEENFADPKFVDSFRTNFEIIAINMWGDRDVISVAGNDYSEKSFAAALNIKYTPTLLFFDENKKVIHRLNGYIPPKDFKLALDFVANKQEKRQTFGEFTAEKTLKDKKTPSTSTNISTKLHEEDFFVKKGFNLDRSKQQKEKYLAVFFEDNNCKDCDLLHEKTLKDETTRNLIKQFEAVQLTRSADTPITTPKGNRITAKKWANRLNIGYLPAIIFFDKTGKEVMRIDAQMRSFHIQSVFDYVLSESYIHEPNFQRYISARADKIRAKGIDVDIWAY